MRRFIPFFSILFLVNSCNLFELELENQNHKLEGLWYLVGSCGNEELIEFKNDSIYKVSLIDSDSLSRSYAIKEYGNDSVLVYSDAKYSLIDSMLIFSNYAETDEGASTNYDTIFIAFLEDSLRFLGSQRNRMNNPYKRIPKLEEIEFDKKYLAGIYYAKPDGFPTMKVLFTTDSIKTNSGSIEYEHKQSYFNDKLPIHEPRLVKNPWRFINYNGYGFFQSSTGNLNYSTRYVKSCTDNSLTLHNFCVYEESSGMKSQLTYYRNPADTIHVK